MSSKTILSQTGTLGAAPPGSSAADIEVSAAMEQLYDHYFSCHDYERRYPQPNHATLDFLTEQGAETARQILDFGCGNGRYGLALLQGTSALLTGCDISEAALAEFSSHLDHAGLGARTRLFHGPASVLEGRGRYDLILMLFGVLSHVGARSARVETLRQLRALMEPGGKLVLTVPSLWRRRPVELLRAAFDRWRGRVQGVRSEPGNILFSRRLGGVSHQFFYHLYTVRRLREELRVAGFQMTLVEAESVLPEWLITQHPWIGGVDARVTRFLPACLGYGMRAVALPV